MSLVEVVVYSKDGCHLCEEVKAQLEKLRRTYPFELREVNIVHDAEAYGKFKDEIPVVFINGEKSDQVSPGRKEVPEEIEDC